MYILVQFLRDDKGVNNTQNTIHMKLQNKCCDGWVYSPKLMTLGGLMKYSDRYFEKRLIVCNNQGSCLLIFQPLHVPFNTIAKHSKEEGTCISYCLPIKPTFQGTKYANMTYDFQYARF